MKAMNAKPKTAQAFTCNIYDFYCKHQLVCLSFVLLIISFLVYKDFFLFQKLYIYTDIGSDVYNQTLPTLGYMADYIRSSGYPWWSFNMGLGQNLYASAFSFGDPFISVAILLGKSALPFSLGYLQAAKPVIAGLFFFLFLKKAKVNSHVSFIVAILYAFCGHIIGRGAWLTYPNEVVWVALVLYAIERYLADSDIKLLPIAVAILFLSLKGYQSLLYTVYFFVYVLLRYYSIHRPGREDFSRFILKYIGLFALGGVISAVIFLPNMMYGFQTARIANYNPLTETLQSTSVFGTIDLKEFFTVFYRTISIDALGAGDQYSGIVNYLEDPLFYCGTISVLLLPQVFFIKDKRKRNAVLIMLALGVCYILFPYVRYAANGFFSKTYKQSSFIIVVFMLFASALTLENMIVKKRINLPVLFCSFLGIGGITFAGVLLDRLNPTTFNFDFDPFILLLCGVFITVYFTVFLLYKKSIITAKIVLLTLAAVVSVEACIFSYNSVNNREFLSNDFVTGEISYNDSANEAIAYLNDRENGGFFRMETNEEKYETGVLCSALYQNYYGVKSYTWQTQENLDFFNFVNAGAISTATNYVYAFNTRWVLNGMLGVKYLIAKQDTLEMPGFALIEKVGEYNIYENGNALALGTAYDQYVYASEVENASNIVRDLTLLQAVAVEDDTVIPEGMVHFDLQSLEQQKTVVPVDMDSLEMSGIEVLSQNDSEMTFRVVDGDSEIKVPVDVQDLSLSEVSFTISYDEDERGYRVVYWIKEGEVLDYFYFVVEKGEKKYDFSGPALDECRIQLRNIGVYTISNIKVASLPESLYEQAAAGHKDEMSITGFSQNNIQGSIACRGNRILVLSMPFDEGWSAYVDGEKTDMMLADRGLTGIHLTKGQHTVELRFTPPYLVAGSILTIGALAIYLFILWKARRKRKN